jgi:hypothetical protein
MPRRVSACCELVFQMRPAMVSVPTRFSPPSDPSGPRFQNRLPTRTWTGAYDFAARGR